MVALWWCSQVHAFVSLASRLWVSPLSFSQHTRPRNDRRKAGSPPDAWNSRRGFSGMSHLGGRGSTALEGRSLASRAWPPGQPTTEVGVEIWHTNSSRRWWHLSVLAPGSSSYAPCGCTGRGNFRQGVCHKSSWPSDKKKRAPGVPLSWKKKSLALIT